MAERSLRAQGTRTTRAVAAARPGPATTTRVGAESPRPEPIGPGPAVTVIRNRPRAAPPASSTAATADRTSSVGTGARPSARAFALTRHLQRLEANARAPVTSHVS